MWTAPQSHPAWNMPGVTETLAGASVTRTTAFAGMDSAVSA